MKKKLIPVLIFCIMVNLTGCVGQELNTNESTEKSIHGAEYITDKNRNLIGTEIVIDGNDNDLTGPGEVKLPYKNIINSIDEKIDFPPFSMNSFIVKEENNKYITPEIIGVNDSVSIFTKKDESGWNLNKGQTLTFNFNKCESRFQSVVIGYIFNGKMMQGEKFKELSGSYQLTANESGEYYIYVRIASSDYVAFKEGNIIIN